MHKRRIGARRALGQTGVAVLGAFSDRHQIGHAVQGTVAARRGHSHQKRACQVDFARSHGRVWADKGRQAFPGQQGTVHF